MADQIKDFRYKNDTDRHKNFMSQSTHTKDEEIFMCEYQSDDSEYVNGFMIEDDYWVFKK